MTFEVRTFYSGCNVNLVEADSEEEAIEIARNMPVNMEQIGESLDTMDECDFADEVDDD